MSEILLNVLASAEAHGLHVRLERQTYVPSILDPTWRWTLFLMDVPRNRSAIGFGATPEEAAENGWLKMLEHLHE